MPLHRGRAEGTKRHRDCPGTRMADKKHAYFRFYGGLNDFLPPHDRQANLRYSFWGRPAVKDAIEAQGIPHTEVDLILANGTPVSFEAPLRRGARVSVYPWIRALDRPPAALRPPLPSPVRFVCDVHLRRLARHLRMLGFDTIITASASDERLAQIATDESRVLLTRDVGLLKRGGVRLGLFIRSQDPETQLREVLGRCEIGRDDVRPFTLCLDCNTPLVSAPPSKIDEDVPPHARQANDTFTYCPECDSVYWNGTHVDAMRRLMRRVFDALR